MACTAARCIWSNSLLPSLSSFLLGVVGGCPGSSAEITSASLALSHAPAVLQGLLVKHPGGALADHMQLFKKLQEGAVTVEQFTLAVSAKRQSIYLRRRGRF